MPNFMQPGKDMPSREDAIQMEREAVRRELEYAREARKVDNYLDSHPSASRAEALYAVQRHYMQD